MDHWQQVGHPQLVPRRYWDQDWDPVGEMLGSECIHQQGRRVSDEHCQRCLVQGVLKTSVCSDWLLQFSKFRNVYILATADAPPYMNTI